MSKLYSSLENFKVKVSNNESVQKLTKNWAPNIIIETMDTNEAFTLLIKDGNIHNILNKEENAHHEIRLEAEEKVLCSIFTGEINPAEAVLNGQLVVFGDTNDQIKLDAITLLIWGM